MRPPTAKALLATLSALLILLFVLLICTSSSSSSSPSTLLQQPSVLRNRRLLSTRCHDKSSCSTPLSGFGRFFKAPATVFESLKKMPKSASNPSHN